MTEPGATVTAKLPLEELKEIGARLRLNVGEPNEALQDPEGKRTLQIRDHLGLLKDPKLYAKKRCNNCGGNGTYQVRNAVHVPGARQRNNMQAELRTCGCVHRLYKKAQTKVELAIHEALRNQQDSVD